MLFVFVLLTAACEETSLDLPRTIFPSSSPCWKFSTLHRTRPETKHDPKLHHEALQSMTLGEDAAEFLSDIENGSLHISANFRPASNFLYSLMMSVNPSANMSLCPGTSNLISRVFLLSSSRIVRSCLEARVSLREVNLFRMPRGRRN